MLHYRRFHKSWLTNTCVSQQPMLVNTFPVISPHSLLLATVYKQIPGLIILFAGYVFNTHVQHKGYNLFLQTFCLTTIATTFALSYRAVPLSVLRSQMTFAILTSVPIQSLTNTDLPSLSALARKQVNTIHPH